jgi:hypothetical protein
MQPSIGSPSAQNSPHEDLLRISVPYARMLLQIGAIVRIGGLASGAVVLSLFAALAVGGGTAFGPFWLFCTGIFLGCIVAASGFALGILISAAGKIVATLADPGLAGAAPAGSRQAGSA